MKVNCKENFGLACQLLAKPAHIFPTIYFQSTIHFQLQFTCTWSGPICISNESSVFWMNGSMDELFLHIFDMILIEQLFFYISEKTSS